jgi:hypothetical protein
MDLSPSLRPLDSPDQGLVGCSFPDLEVLDHSGLTRTLSSVAAGDPLLLTTYRGPWCPKEQTFFRQVLLALQQEADVSYIRMASLSIDVPAVAYAFRAGLGARWPFLCDPTRTHLQALGLGESTDTVHDPYAPYAFVLSPQLVVRAAWNGYWYSGRPTLAELQLALRAASRELRPDWQVP